MPVEFIAPNIKYVNNQLFSDRCVWCGQKKGLTRSHLVPEFLGGWFKPFISCAECNSFLGSKIEVKANENGILTAALVKLGLKNEQEAYRNLEKIDTESGVEMIFKNGKALPQIKEDSDGRFIATPEKSKAKLIAEFGRRFPGDSTKSLEDFLDDPDSKDFLYPGMNLKKEDYPEKVTNIQISGTRQPDPFFIFKMAYEICCMNGFMNYPEIKKRLRKFITISSCNNKNRILISDQVKDFLIDNTLVHFNKFKDLKDISFSNLHSFIFRISREGYLYLEIILFGVIINLFIICQFDKTLYDLLPLIDLMFIFDINKQCKYPPLRYSNLAYMKHSIWTDASVDLKMKNLMKSNYDKSN